MKYIDGLHKSLSLFLKVQQNIKNTEEYKIMFVDEE